MSGYHALADALESRAVVLAERTLQVMQDDPLWNERFGVQSHGDAWEDMPVLVQYLAESLRRGSAQRLIKYAQWLQEVLTARGLCTHHIAEAFVRLGEVIRQDRIPGVQIVLAYLELATYALRYSGPAGMVQAAAPRLVDAVIDAVVDDSANEYASLGAEDIRQDSSIVVSYLADALHSESPPRFVEAMRWLHSSFDRHGRPPYYLATVLVRLDDALEIVVSDDASLCWTARQTLAAAHTELTGRVEEPPTG